MHKPFRSISQQVSLLQGRGVRTDDQTPTILLREGYYAVVNGYGKAFIDEGATQAAGDDRYLRGTTFNDIYQLFLFDRELRALTFRAIMSVEGTLRSVLSHTFCECHRSAEAYLDRSCYTGASSYLRGAQKHADDLEWMMSTLRRHANGFLTPDDDGEPPTAENARVAWYRERYESVPLWVLFSDLTFGNLRYFYALMRKDEQRTVCRRLKQTCGTSSDGQTLSRSRMLRHLETLSDLRNDCAHVERIYDSSFGDEELSYPEVLDVLAAFLADDDEEALRRGIDAQVAKAKAESPAVAAALRNAGL